MVGMTPFRKISRYRPQPWILVAVFAIVFFSTPTSSSVRVLVDQVGYELQTTKQALVIGAKGDPAPGTFALIDADSGRTVLEGPLRPAGDVYNWRGMVFWTADFSAWR